MEHIVSGPHFVGVLKLNNGRRINEESIGSFWDQSKLEKDIGCYLFGLAKAKGKLEPWYVGKATKSFKQEVFATDKLHKYNEVLASVKGKPFLFLLSQKYATKPSKSAIEHLERFLIQVAFEANGNLLNKQGLPRDLFQIRGVWPLKRGTTKAAAAKKLRKALAL